MGLLEGLTVLALAAGPLPAEVRAAKEISAPLLAGHIRFLSSDLLEGRGPASPGDALAQQYIAAQMEALGLEPGGADGSWFQTFDLVGVHGYPDTLSVSAGAAPLVLKHSQDFMVVAGRAKSAVRMSSAPLVFVGYGIVAPEFQWDDFKGVDVRGKVLVVLNNDPQDDPALFAGKTRLWYGRWDYKYHQAAKLGAAGVLIVHTRESAGYPWQVVQTSWSGEQFSLPGEDEVGLEFRGWLTEDAAKKSLALSKHSLEALVAAAQKRDFRPVDLSSQLSLEFSSKIRQVKTGNVLGKLAGAHPKRGEEGVFFTAHHDHLGRKENAAADAIYNGAQDNASGVAQMLAVARAFVALPKRPERSVWFAAVGAEEQGLLGSAFLANHPPIPVGRIAAVLNIDGANIFGRTRDLTVIGLGKSSLDAAIQASAKHQQRRVVGDAFPDRGFFYRSDQFSFAKVGVPGVYFEGGLDYVGRPAAWGRTQREAWEARDYHQPSDELTPSWDFAGIMEDAQLYFWTGVAIAREPKLPHWRAGDEFEAARLAALRALQN
ncbi:MAG: M28 family peptidase [Myxococcaceae bacterium]